MDCIQSQEIHDGSQFPQPSRYQSIRCDLLPPQSQTLFARLSVARPQRGNTYSSRVNGPAVRACGHVLDRRVQDALQLGREVERECARVGIDVDRRGRREVEVRACVGVLRFIRVDFMLGLFLVGQWFE